jgi:hypothetical protein
MKKLVFLLSISLIGLTPAQADVISPCPSSYLNKVVGNKVCKKIGFLYRWTTVSTLKPKPSVTPAPVSKPSLMPIPTPATAVPAPSTTPAPTVSNMSQKQEICANDSKADSSWKPLQSMMMKYQRCEYTILRYQNYNYEQYSGNTVESLSSLPTDQCKIKQTNGAWSVRGFANRTNQSHPGPNTVIQVVPIQTTDVNTSTTPNQDYGQYFKFLEDWMKNNSDVSSSAIVRVPSQYIKLNKSLKDYPGISGHGKPTSGGHAWHTDLMTAADPYINFTGTDIVLVVVPPNTDISLLGGNPWGTEVNTNEGIYGGTMLTVPPSNTNYPDWHPNLAFINPTSWIHEIHHSSLDFGSIYDMQYWGGYGANPIDINGWHKWISGFFFDSSIHCLDKNKQSTFVLTPSVVHGNYKKLSVIPISSTKAIIIESMKQGGYNYKMPKSSEGVLIYEVDVAETDTLKGENIISTPAGMLTENLLGATLKVGDSITKYGITITIISSGKYGDVVKVN